MGRTFTNDEAVTPNTSVIISRSAAEKLWLSAVGEVISIPAPPGWTSIAFPLSSPWMVTDVVPFSVMGSRPR